MRNWMWCATALMVAGLAGAFWMARRGVAKPDSSVGQAIAWFHRRAFQGQEAGGTRPENPPGAEEAQELHAGTRRLPRGGAAPEEPTSKEPSSPIETIVVEVPEPTPPRLVPREDREREPLAFENGAGEVQIVAGAVDGSTLDFEQMPLHSVPPAGSGSSASEGEEAPDLRSRLTKAAWDSMCAVTLPCWLRPLTRFVVVRAVREDTEKSVTLRIGAHAPYLPPLVPERKKTEGFEESEESEFGIEVGSRGPELPAEMPSGETDRAIRPEIDPHHGHCPGCSRYCPAPYRYRFHDRRPERIPQP